jgi:hypothetical protein
MGKGPFRILPIKLRGNSQFISVFKIKQKNAFCKAKVPQNCQFFLKRIEDRIGYKTLKSLKLG